MKDEGKAFKNVLVCIAALFTFIIIVSIIYSTPPKLKGAWEIENEEEIIFFLDNDTCVCDGDEMIYRIMDKDTIALDGDVYNFRITDRKNKKMIICDSY